MSKKTLVIFGLIALLATGLAITIPVNQVNALTDYGMNRVIAQENRASLAAQRQNGELSRIIQRADQLISVRLTTLQNLLNRVQNDKRLSDADKTSFTSDINSTVNSLNSLKTKIDADTDVTTARTDAKSIITTYRIYMIFEPKIRLLVVIGNLQSASANIATLVTKVQNLLTTLKSQGSDVTAAQTALNDISTQLTTLNGILSTDKTLVDNVSLSTSNPQSVFVQVRQDLATVRQDVAKIRADFATIRSTIKIVHAVTSPAASASAK